MMYIILSYDISSKKISKVKKTCDMYLAHIQKSVYEGEISQKNLSRLQSLLEGMIDTEKDSIVIYRFNAPKYANRDSIGTVKFTNHSFL